MKAMSAFLLFRKDVHIPVLLHRAARAVACDSTAFMNRMTIAVSRALMPPWFTDSVISTAAATDQMPRVATGAM